MGYDFTGGRIFDFPIDFSMDLTTSLSSVIVTLKYRCKKLLFYNNV